MRRVDDLVVFSHLRWDWVWQRPQHLVSRIGARRRVWFVEEPHRTDVSEPSLRIIDAGAVRRVVVDVPVDTAPRDVEHLVFEDHLMAHYVDALEDLVHRDGLVTWLYTPLALPMAHALDAELVVFDVMDDLAAFKDASPKLRRRHVETLASADVVFTGGRSLHESATRHRRHDVHCFPSGVEVAHYARAAALRGRNTRTRPVAGYVGVVDERLDLELLDEVAERMPDWDIDVIGPVAKISPETLPRRRNLRYRGPAPYARLPETMATLDVALMPFALNEATRSISPTKTLEYLAADLPVVSTRVPDVVAEFPTVVLLADDAASFEHACRVALVADAQHRRSRARPMLASREWDVIARAMDELITQARSESRFAAGSKRLRGVAS